jgi:hypothetical protein
VVAADADLAHLDLARPAARGQHGRGRFGHAEADGGHGFERTEAPSAAPIPEPMGE